MTLTPSQAAAAAMQTGVPVVDSLQARAHTRTQQLLDNKLYTALLGAGYTGHLRQLLTYFAVTAGYTGAPVVAPDAVGVGRLAELAAIDSALRTRLIGVGIGSVVALGALGYVFFVRK